MTTSSTPVTSTQSSQRLAQLGLVINALLAVVKLVAGLLGNAYALVADAIESSTDMVGSLVVWSGLRIASRDPDERYPFGYGRAEALVSDAIESSTDMVGSLVVWSGLRIASRDPDERYPFGYGRAEALAGAVVAALMLGAAAGIAIEAVREIRTPHHAPAPWTLAVLAVVIVVKEVLAKKVLANSEATGSTVVAADAWHHRADAITSAAAFIGISVAIIGGPGWEPADDWAALVAAAVIAVNGGLILRTAARDLMDRAPGAALQDTVSTAALATSGVLAIEKLKIRKSGTSFYVDIHVQADPGMSLHDAHILSGRVKTAIRQRVPAAAGVLIHMEPFEPSEET